MPASKRRTPAKLKTATHRPATRRRMFRHDDLIAVDLFSGFGGLTEGIRRAGFTTIVAANHNEYKTRVHERNHPDTEHWIADLVDTESPAYHSARDLPAADILVAGVSCTNHSSANTKKAYARALSLFDLEDPEFEARVTRSERDRATANCVLAYAQQNHPLMILVECTTELQSWGPGLPNRPTVGDGSTFRWWRKEHRKLGYKQKLLYLNSMFFGVGQSRDRLFIVMWDERIPDPDLEHRPESWCAHCDKIVQAQWTWRTGVPPTGTVRYGQQYDYRCPSCRGQVFPPATASLDALDLTNLGSRIGDKPIRKHRDGSIGPLAAGTMARAGRCLQRMPDFPAILLPGQDLPGGHPWQPAGAGPDTMSTGALVVAAGNTYERPGSDCRSRDLAQPMWTQPATNQLGLLTPPAAITGHVVAAHRHNGEGQHIGRPMDTITSTHEKAMVIAVNNFQGSPRSISEPLPTQPGSETLSLVSAGVLPFRKHTIPTVHTEAMPTMTSDQIPGLVTTHGQVTAGAAGAQWAARLRQLTVNDLFFRMLFPHEVGRACGFDTSFPGRPGTFTVWGTAKEQVDGFGNAVTPGVGVFLGGRMRASLHAAKGVTVPAQRRPDTPVPGPTMRVV